MVASDDVVDGGTLASPLDFRQISVQLAAAKLQPQQKHSKRKWSRNVATNIDRINSATVARVEDADELAILLRCYIEGINRRVNNASG